MNLKGKVVAITGASSGIGQELAFQFARKGCSVSLAARRGGLISQHADLINKNGGHAMAVTTDVAQRTQVESFIHQTVNKFGRLDILINNAAISPGKGTILENPEKDVRDTMEVNFMGSLYGLWAAVPHLEKAGGGQVVFISSIVGKRGIPFNSAYCASKFAIQGLTESIRPELARKNIRIITICPAGVATPFYENNGKSRKKEYHLHSVEKIGRGIVQACEKEKREVLLTMDAKLLHYLNVLAPKLMDIAIAKVKGV